MRNATKIPLIIVGSGGQPDRNLKTGVRLDEELYATRLAALHVESTGSRQD